MGRVGCTSPSAYRAARPIGVTRNERTADGHSTNTNSDRDFGFLLNILHLSLSVTPWLVSGRIDLTTD
jgi:hypothetical protein